MKLIRRKKDTQSNDQPQNPFSNSLISNQSAMIAQYKIKALEDELLKQKAIIKEKDNQIYMLQKRIEQLESRLRSNPPASSSISSIPKFETDDIYDYSSSNNNIITQLNDVLTFHDTLIEKDLNDVYPNPDTKTYEQLLMLENQLGNVKKGYSRREIERLPYTYYVKDFKQDECIICQDMFKVKEKIRKLPCEHIFHVNCIDKWFEEDKKCPCCKKEVFII